MINKDSAIKGAIELSIAEKRNNFVVAEAYTKWLIESKTVLRQGEHFGFTDQKKRDPKIIKIYPTPNGGIPKTQVAEMISTLLEGEGEIVSDKDKPFVHIDAKTISAPRWFTENMKIRGKEVKAITLTSESSTKKITSSECDLILKAIELNHVLAFEKSRDKDSIVFSLPPTDDVEKKSALSVFNSFGFKYEVCKDFCIKVFVNEKITESEIITIPGFKPTEHKRFSKTLEDSIIITKWEIQRQAYNMQSPLEDLTNDVTKSGPFRMNDTYANRTLIENFSGYMFDEYGVCINQNDREPYSFRVLSPKDDAYAESESEQIQRQRRGKAQHEVTAFLLSKGFHMASNVPEGEVGLVLHLKEGWPDSIGLVHGSKDQKIQTAKAIATELKPFLKSKHYKLNGFNKAGTGVHFKPHSGLDTVTVLLIGGGFKPLDQANKDAVGFLVRNIEDHKLVSFKNSDEKSRRTETIKAVKFLESKGKNIITSNRSGYSFKLYGVVEGSKNIITESQETKLEQVVVQKVQKSKPGQFLESITDAFLEEIESNHDLQEKVIARLHNKVGFDKYLLGTLLGELIAVTESKSFEIPGTDIKYVKFTDIALLLGELVNKTK